MNHCMFAKYALLTIIGLGCIGLMSPPSNAQSTYGSISGTVSDSSGGAISDVEVTLTNLETGSKLTDKTGVEGFYVFKNLFAGHYRVTAEKTGFKRSEMTDVIVQVQQTSSINLTMQETPPVESAIFRTGITSKTSIHFPRKTFPNAWSSAMYMTCPSATARSSCPTQADSRTRSLLDGV